MPGKYFSAFLSAFFLAATAFAQDKDTTSKFSLSWDLDAYYAYYTDSVGAGNYQKFPSVSPRDGFGLNMAMLTALYEAKKVRATLALHYGDIPRSAWAPPAFNNIMEAHAGVRLSKKIWLDAGFFRTHIGTEGLLPKENIASSISVPTFFEPYFESGARLVYTPNDKLAINLYILNGYNIFEDNNKQKSGGALVTYALGDKGNIGYSNYVGDDTPEAGDSISHLRIYQNAFFNYKVKKLKIQAGADYGIQANSGIDDSGKVMKGESASMYSAILSLKYELKPKFAVYARGDMFNDPSGFLSGPMKDKTGRVAGLKEMGYTLGVEYKPVDYSYIRLEARQIQLDKDQEIFRWNNTNTSSRLEIQLNMGISF
jgi:hypothetical protein